MEWMAQADPSKEASSVKKQWTVANALNKITNYFKNGLVQVVFWKKSIVFTKTWCLK